MKNHLFVFACLMLVGLISCEKIDDAEEALVDSQDSQIQLLKVMQAKGQSIRFWYDNQGMVVHSEEADSFGYRYTYAKRDYVYELDKSRIISRNLYLYQYQIETNDVDRLDYRDTLFLNKQKTEWIASTDIWIWVGRILTKPLNNTSVSYSCMTKVVV